MENKFKVGDKVMARFGMYSGKVGTVMEVPEYGVPFYYWIELAGFNYTMACTEDDVTLIERHPQEPEFHRHDWKVYNGFTDTFEYCGGCGIKRT